MTSTTIILSTERRKGSFIFSTSKGGFFVKSFADGIAIVDPPCGAGIADLAKIVEGCFNSGSNFQEKLQECFNTEDNLEAIKILLNDVVVTATSENDAEWILKEYERLEAEDWERYQKELEEYHKTKEYQIKRAAELKEAMHRQAVWEKIKNVAQQTELEFKDEAAKARWEEILEINSGDPTCEFATYWAKYMQHLMKEGAELDKIADETSIAADMFGMSGFTYGYAVSMLCECWKYGDELRRWNNKIWGLPEDTEGVVNPAIISVSVG